MRGISHQYIDGRITLARKRRKCTRCTSITLPPAYSRPGLRTGGTIKPSRCTRSTVLWCVGWPIIGRCHLSPSPAVHHPHRSTIPAAHHSRRSSPHRSSIPPFIIHQPHYYMYVRTTHHHLSGRLRERRRRRIHDGEDHKCDAGWSCTGLRWLGGSEWRL